MKLLVGLGNPRIKYQYNRHNVGFMMLDYIVEQIKSEKIKVKSYSEKFTVDKYSHSKRFEFQTDGDRIILIKPQTFMNNSGKSVQSLTTSYKLPTTELIVVHDDLDIRLGEFKIQFGKGPKLHNGVESIENALAFKDFWRVRIGVDNRSGENRITGDSYVLQNFLPEEMVILQNTFAKILSEMLDLFHG